MRPRIVTTIFLAPRQLCSCGARNKHGETCRGQPLNEHVLDATYVIMHDSEKFLCLHILHAQYFYTDTSCPIFLQNIADFEIFFSSSISSFYDAVEILSLKIDVRRTLWLSDPIKRFMPQYFIGDAENCLTGKMRNGISIERSGNPFCAAGEFYSRIE